MLYTLLFKNSNLHTLNDSNQEPTPVPYIEDMKEATVFHINRVLKENKEKEKYHSDYVNGFKDFLLQMKDYVKSYHTTGISWNTKGGDANSFKSSGLNAPVVESAAPPPPPAPTAAQLEQFSSGVSKPAGGVFDELSKGNVTAGKPSRKIDF